MPRRQFLKGSFIITLEHLSMTMLSEEELITEFLQGVEIEHSLKPLTAVVYYMETKGDSIREYFWTEKENVRFIADFQRRIYGLNQKVNPTLN